MINSGFAVSLIGLILILAGSLVLKIEKNKISRFAVAAILLSFIQITSFFLKTPVVLPVAVTNIVSLICYNFIFLVKREWIENFLKSRVLAAFLLTLAAGVFSAILFTKLPGSLILTQTNPNHDIIEFYPFSFFIAGEGRYGSIFIEPGYYGMFLISFILSKVLIGRVQKTDILILASGLLTYSLTYLVSLLGVWVISAYRKNAKKINFLILGVPSICVAAVAGSLIFFFIFRDSWLLTRIYELVTNLEANVRYIHFSQMLNHPWTFEEVLFGLNACRSGSDMCMDIVGNPFAPVVNIGVLGNIYFISIFIYLFVRGIFVRPEVLIACLVVFVLITAKPVYHIFPYSIFIAFILKSCLINLKIRTI